MKSIRVKILCVSQILITVAALGIILLRPLDNYVFDKNTIVFDSGVINEQGVFVHEENDIEGEEELNYGVSPCSIISPTINIKPGSYDIVFSYETDTNYNTYDLLLDGYATSSLSYDSDSTLPMGKHTYTTELRTTKTLNDFSARIVFQGTGSILVSSIAIIENNDLAWEYFTCFCFLLVLMDGLWMISHTKKWKDNYQIATGIILISFIASMPLFVI